MQNRLRKFLVEPNEQRVMIEKQKLLYGSQVRAEEDDIRWCATD